MNSELERLKDIRQKYSSYEGSAFERVSKTGIAVEEFESVLDAAIFLAIDVEDLKAELDNKQKHETSTGLTRQQEFEDNCLDDEEPCEIKQAADFARYG